MIDRIFLAPLFCRRKRQGAKPRWWPLREHDKPLLIGAELIESIDRKSMVAWVFVPIYLTRQNYAEKKEKESPTHLDKGAECIQTEKLERNAKSTYEEPTEQRTSTFPSERSTRSSETSKRVLYLSRYFIWRFCVLWKPLFSVVVSRLLHISFIHFSRVTNEGKYEKKLS